MNEINVLRFVCLQAVDRSSCGSFYLSFSLTAATLTVSSGREPTGSSNSWIPTRRPGNGASVKVNPTWTTTSWAELYDTTTTRTSWLKCTASATRTSLTLPDWPRRCSPPLRTPRPTSTNRNCSCPAPPTITTRITSTSWRRTLLSRPRPQGFSRPPRPTGEPAPPPISTPICPTCRTQPCPTTPVTCHLISALTPTPKPEVARQRNWHSRHAMYNISTRTLEGHSGLQWHICHSLEWQWGALASRSPTTVALICVWSMLQRNRDTQGCALDPRWNLKLSANPGLWYSTWD